MADNNNNASTMMVALIAILVIVAIGFIALRLLPGDTAGDNGSGIDLEVTGGGTGGADLNPGE